MSTKKRFFHKSSFGSNYTIILAFFWCIGLLIGVLTARGVGERLYVIVQNCAHSEVNLPNLICLFSLLILLSVCVVYIHKPHFIYLLIFAKGFAFAFSAYAAYFAFSTAGWLIAPLLMFSDCITSFAFLLFSVRHISGKTDSLFSDAMFLVISAIIVYTLDYNYISPFVIRIFQ